MSEMQFTVSSVTKILNSAFLIFKTFAQISADYKV